MTTQPQLPHPPFANPVSGADSFFSVRHDMMGFVARVARECGDVGCAELGPVRLYLLNHPDYVKDVLVTNHRNFHKAIGLEPVKRLLGEGLLTAEEDAHRRRRRLAQPAFHRQRIAEYGRVMVSYAARMRERWQDGVKYDTAQEMMRLTLAIVGKTLFDADVEGDAETVWEAMAEISEMSNVIAFPFYDRIEKFMLSGARRFERAQARLDETLFRVIAERRASGEDRGDLLSMLLLAQDEEEGGNSMSDRQLRDEAMTIFLAGHETMANALTWTFHLLSENPEAEARMHEEIDRELGGRSPEVADVGRLAYTERVLTESMRRLPPVWLMARRSLEDYDVGGYRIPGGSLVLMSQIVLHNDPRFYDEPERFDPDRWTAETKAALPKFAYFPFGGGPRQCIGEPFAWMEGVLLLATIAQQWRLRRVPTFQVELQPSVIMRPKNGLHMVFERRSGAN